MINRKIVIVAWLLAALFVSAQEQDVPAPERHQLLALSLARDTVEVAADSITTLVILMNRYNCRACFAKIDDYLQHSSCKDSLRVVAVCRVGRRSLDRREAASFMRAAMPSVDTVLFDIQPGRDPYPPRDVEGGLHGALDIRYTPALAIISEFGFRLLQYSDVFVSALDEPERAGELSEEGKQKLAVALGCD